MIDFLQQKRELNTEDKYKVFNLESNPFPKSGTANINESTERTIGLMPVDKNVLNKLIDFIGDSLYSEDTEDQKLIGTISGDYGTGKTQLLLFARSLILNEPKKSYVLYINNPGTKLSELVGSVIENIGHEQFKKFIWGQILESISKNEEYIKKLNVLPLSKQQSLFEDNNNAINQLDIESTVSYKLFIDRFIGLVENKSTRKLFEETLKPIVLEILRVKNGDDAVIANYFYQLIVDEFGVNKTWESLTSGSGIGLDKKVVKLLNAIISIVRDQGFQRFYLLVDEFEDITSGRLSKKEQDNYTQNLRTLIDKERRWCVLFAMTSNALEDIARLSPPLYDRLTDRKILIQRITNEQARVITYSYLSTARKDEADSIVDSNMNLYPFTIDAIDEVNNKSLGSPRIFLRSMYQILERAVEFKSTIKLIDKDFITKHLDWI